MLAAKSPLKVPLTVRKQGCEGAPAEHVYDYGAHELLFVSLYFFFLHGLVCPNFESVSLELTGAYTAITYSVMQLRAVLCFECAALKDVLPG